MTAQSGEQHDAGTNDVSVFRDRDVSYLELPAADVAVSARFYSAVFGWTVRGEGDNRGFTDGSGHLIGHWRPDLSVAGDAGVRPYVYVAAIDDVVAAILQNGGEIVTPRYAEGELWVAHFRDPAGNVLGVWEHP